jgi:hypothetical protein
LPAAIAEQDEAVGKAKEIDYSQIGVMAGLEWSPEPFASVTDEEKKALRRLAQKAAKRDYPARIVEIVQAWEAALFYRGFQFLIPREGGGWLVPGESSGYGPSMQIDLSLLPTNIYGSYAQMIMSALTRTVPPVRFEAQDANDNKGITAAASADKFVKVIARNNPLKVIQNDATRFLWCDGRYLYWSRYVKDGQQFGWENEDAQEYVPETEPSDDQAAQMEAQKLLEDQPEEDRETPATLADQERIESAADAEDSGKEDADEEPTPRVPRGQEVRTVHGKLETKLVPMMANSLAECDVVQLEWEYDVSRAKGMFYWVAEKIRGGSTGIDEGEIARLARQNTKLGMQSAYITSDSIAEDVTVQRSWMRPSYFEHVTDKDIKKSLQKKFPDGVLVVFAGEIFCYARNEAIEASLALGSAYSGDGQNRNALGTGFLPAQKRINNWLDLMNDYFVRGVPKIWHDNKAFDAEAIKNQTNIPGDRGVVKRPPNTNVDQLVWAEPQIQAPVSLPDFVKQYIGPLGELLTGGYPALSGGNTGSNDTAKGIAEQRDQALGRLGPTWHFIVSAETTSMLQLVKWGAKCRNGSITEKIPGGEIIKLESANLQAGIMCFPESDENFPESWSQKQQRFLSFIGEAGKNPKLGEVIFNPKNLKTLQWSVGLGDFYIKQVASLDKQEGELEVLLSTVPIPNVMKQQAKTKVEAMVKNGGDMEKLAPVIKQIEAMPDFSSSVPVDEKVDDHEVEAFGVWVFLTSAEGRKLKRTKPKAYDNARWHYLEHIQAEQAKSSAPKQVPKVSANYKDIAANDPNAGTQIISAAGFVPSPPAPPAAPAGQGQ